MQSADPVHNLCGRKTRGGSGTCKNPPMLGQSVCRMHGGQSPQALAKAEDRMRALIHPAIASLARQINADEFNAVRYVLDYAGFRAAVEVKSDQEITIRVITEDQPITLESVAHRLNGYPDGRTHS